MFNANGLFLQENIVIQIMHEVLWGMMQLGAAGNVNIFD